MQDASGELEKRDALLRESEEKHERLSIQLQESKVAIDASKVFGVLIFLLSSHFTLIGSA